MHQPDFSSFPKIESAKSSCCKLGSTFAEMRILIDQMEAQTVSHDGNTVGPAAILRARRLRDSIFGADLFADPAWDMLLELYESTLRGDRLSVSGLCVVSTVPPTTALRWMKELERRGLIAREDDRFDGRRVWVALTEDGESKMRQCFERRR